MRELSSLLIIFLFLSGCKHPESNYYEERIYETESIIENKKNTLNECFKVIGVKDGDTFVILFEGKEQVVRFAHIDCPEKKQPFGKKAKYFVSDICFGKNIKLIHENKYDRYKRLIAEIILEDGTNLNKELVKQGLAWHFKKYSDNLEYSNLEIEAKNYRIGLWSEENPIAPWEWRK
ncbi:thermonuclease family protein [Flavobacterium lacustre]|uniref:thermonuclease family protein n=1 Tax=Flavobacterium lacustre TaxID=3016339 RepID=UPI0022B6E456|nr:thermonuclease family protein [Flavobacterium lacustre]